MWSSIFKYVVDNKAVAPSDIENIISTPAAQQDTTDEFQIICAAELKRRDAAITPADRLKGIDI